MRYTPSMIAIAAALSLGISASTFAAGDASNHGAAPSHGSAGKASMPKDHDDEAKQLKEEQEKTDEAAEKELEENVKAQADENEKSGETPSPEADEQ